jgi:hypothetical protein
MLSIMRCRVSLAMPLMVFLAPVIAAAGGQEGGRAWKCLDERQISAALGQAGQNHLRAELKSAGAGGRCEAWLPQASGADGQGDAAVIAVPEGLSRDFVVVPLPLRSWDYSSIEPIRQIVFARDSAGIIRAQTAVPKELHRRPAVTIPTALARHPYEVFDFSRDVLGASGNKFGSFSGRGAAVALERRGTGAQRNLVVSLSGSGQGFGGIWVELASHQLLGDPDSGLNAAEAAAIVIHGRGRAAGAVAISDVAAAKRDAPVVIGSLAAVVPQPDGSWEWKGVIPAAVDRSHLRTLTIDLTGTGDGSIELNDIWLVSADDSIPPRGDGRPNRAASGHRGLWVWNTEEVLVSDASYAPLRDAVRGWSITDVFLQLPYRLPSMGSWSAGPASKRLAVLVARLHHEGVAVHALDGAPFMATASAKPLVESQARRVVKFNKSWGPDGAFDALHLDIEPYTLPAFGGRRRDELLRSYVDVIAAAKAAVSPLPLWLDIPFWYDEADETAVCDCPFRDGVLAKLVQLADGIAVMAYRTSADGANGIAAQAFGELSMAAKWNRKSLLGLETVFLPPEDQWHVALKDELTVERGTPIAVMPRVTGSAPYMLFATAASDTDLIWLKQHGADYRLFTARLVRGPDPATVTFHGASRGRIENAANAASALLRDGGVPFDGIALHELRTLPTP